MWHEKPSSALACPNARTRYPISDPRVCALDRLERVIFSVMAEPPSTGGVFSPIFVASSTAC
jgi:hypothetical protein